MKPLTFALPLLLLACSDGKPTKWSLCEQARTPEEQFGRPGALGPCVETVHNHSAFMDASSVLFTHRVSRKNVMVTWIDGRIVGVSS